ncbi:HD domain-containing protein [Thermodesulfobacteriota bacterium]
MIVNYQIDKIFIPEKIKPQFRKIFDLVVPFLKTRQNDIHTYIVYQYALILIEKEPGDPEVVIPACILHDAGWSCIPEDKQLTAFGSMMKDGKLRRKHELEGVVIAERILNTVGYDPRLIQRISAIIDGHDSTEEARSIDDAITKDADKLFRISNIGFSIDSKRFNADPLPRIRYLNKKIHEWFLTPTGKEMALHEAHNREKEIMNK